MGIKNLNRFLMDNCSKNAIKKLHLSKLSGKKIAVDVSIYIYKFMTDNQLLEKMYLLITMLKHYNIESIFVFDGKAPTEKKDLLEKRRMEKMEAKKKYYELMDQLDTTSQTDMDEIRAEMDILKRKFVTVNENILNKVKELLDAYGVQYLVSPAEADTFCAYLMHTNQVWACLSDDMDMFLYGGSTRIMRSLSLHNHTVFYYDKPTILFELNMDEKLFTDIMVLSGTDYNLNMETSLHETIRWVYQYRIYIGKTDEKIDFYGWLNEHTRYIKEYESLKHIRNMFQLDNDICELYNNIDINNKKNIDVERLHKIMEREGFIFL